MFVLLLFLCVFCLTDALLCLQPLHSLKLKLDSKDAAMGERLSMSDQQKLELLRSMVPEFVRYNFLPSKVVSYLGQILEGQ